MIYPIRDSRIIECSFTSDGYIIQGVLHLPAVESPPVVIGSHGLLSTGESPKQVEMARQCSSNGIAFLRIDHRGRGKSQGPADEMVSLAGRCRDIVDAAHYLDTRPEAFGKKGLFGSSMGGAACIMAFDEVSAAALITYAAPVRSRQLADRLQEANHSVPIETASAQRRLHFELADRLNSLHHVLVIHGDADEVVPAADAQEIYAEAQLPKRIVIQPGGDHRMSRPSHQRSFIRESVEWYKSCFGRFSSD